MELGEAVPEIPALFLSTVWLATICCCCPVLWFQWTPNEILTEQKIIYFHGDTLICVTMCSSGCSFHEYIMDIGDCFLLGVCWKFSVVVYWYQNWRYRLTVNPYTVLNVSAFKGSHHSQWCGPSLQAVSSQSCHCSPDTIHKVHFQSYRRALGEKKKKKRHFKELYWSMLDATL